MHRRNARYLRRIFGDLLVQPEVAYKCDCKLGEYGDRCFDCHGMLALHVCPRKRMLVDLCFRMLSYSGPLTCRKDEKTADGRSIGLT